MKRAFLCAAAIALSNSLSWAATLEGTYFFQNSLAAQQSGAPSLTAVDPTSTSGFVSDPLLGGRTVYNFSGATTPSLQGGLSLNTTGLLPANSYSVETYFKFFNNASAWRRIIDVQNRQVDNGFYVDPNNQLDVYPVTPANSSTAFTNNTYHDVTLTDNSGVVTAYLDGVSTFSITTTVMDINNPGNLMNFFLDNLVGGGQGEYSAGDIAALRVYSGALSASDVAALAANPFAGGTPSSAPEPATYLLLSISLAGLAAYRRRARNS